ncbi:MAG TPA: M17 family peptidase N-terminal domain-containing protein, partial [Burkholderiales bacterium]|nr:M17 family peptidase N-terminal domain-containing protein [Burkholderiales bacterium]
MRIKFAPVSLPQSGVLVLLVPAGAKLSGIAAQADENSGNFIARAIKTAGFEANREQILDMLVPFGSSLRRVILAGLGDPAKLQARDLELIGG